MTALMPTPAAAALADMHSEPSTDPPRLGQLVLILILSVVVLDLPATLAPRLQRRLQLLIHFRGRLAMPMPAVVLPRPTPRPARLFLRGPTRERRRLTLRRAPRLLQQALQLPNSRPQPLVLARHPSQLRPQRIVLRRQRRTQLPQPSDVILRLGREHLNLGSGDGNHHHRSSHRAT